MPEVERNISATLALHYGSKTYSEREAACLLGDCLYLAQYSRIRHMENRSTNGAGVTVREIRTGTSYPVYRTSN